MEVQEIIVEPPIGDRLAALADQVMLCDSGGQRLGIFIPLAINPSDKNSSLALPLPLAEIQELRKSREGKPLEEILSRLGIS